MADSVRGPGGAQLVVLGDAEELAREAARRLVDGLARAIELRGQAHVALTGGSSAVTLYRELAAEWRTAVDWSQVHLWWGDERFVPVDHPDSNTGLAYATLLAASTGRGASGAGSEGPAREFTPRTCTRWRSTKR